MKTAVVVVSALALGAIFAACATGDEPVTVADVDAAPGVADATDERKQDAGTLAQPDSGSIDDATADAIDAAEAEAEAEAAPSCIEDDAGCATGNPGACAAGARHCDGGSAVCEPLQTTQSCYTGIPATRGIGACHDGTQSCIGALGTCNGEQRPTNFENCFNTTDDDCDGRLNNGCPMSVSLGGDRPLAGAGGGGGGANTVHCPIGAFVNRVDSWFDDPDKHASGVSIYCVTPGLIQGASSYSISLTPNAPAPYGTATGSTSPTNERHDDCGIIGLTAITYSVGIADTYVQGLGHHCGTSAVTLNADNSLAISFATNGDTTYNTWTGAPGAFFNRGCNANEVIVGFTLHTGSWMDNIQPICAALQVTYR